jgi:hypothetical protein
MKAQSVDAPVEEVTSTWCARARDELWEAVRGAVGQRGAWRRPSSYVKDSRGFSLSGEVGPTLGASYGAWVSAVEAFFLQLYDVPHAERFRFEGRGRPRELRWTARSPPSGPDRPADPVAAWWAKVAGLAAALADALRGQAAGDERWMVHRLRSHLAAECAHVPARGCLDLEPEEVDGWQTWFRAAPTWSMEAASAAADSLRALASRSQRAAAYSALKGFHAWVAQSAASGAGKLHRWSKEAVLAPSEVYGVEGTPLGAAAALEAKRAFWVKRWSVDGAFEVECAALKGAAGSHPREVPQRPAVPAHARAPGGRVTPVSSDHGSWVRLLGASGLLAAAWRGSVGVPAARGCVAVGGSSALAADGDGDGSAAQADWW